MGPKGKAQRGGGPKGLEGGGPKISRFFPSLAPIFVSLFFLSLGVFSCLFFSLWGSSREILVVFWSAGTLKCARFRPRAVV